MPRPIPHADHKKFVEDEGWTQKSTPRGSAKTGDHHQYTLHLADGRVLATRVSHGAGELKDSNLVAHVLSTQLEVTEKDFWACVNKGTLPPRPQPQAPATPPESLDAKLVQNLIRKVGLSIEEVGELSMEEAVARWQEYLTSGGS